MGRMFDYEQVARRIGAAPEQLTELERTVRTQYGDDEMLFELPMLRTLEAVSEGHVSLPDAIALLSAEGDRTARAG
jgi:hypothetical protein